MTLDEFRSVLHKAPFAPFTIRLADGHTLDVPHPDFVALTGGGLSAVVTFPKSNAFTVVDLMLVTRLEIAAPSQPLHS